MSGSVHIGVNIAVGTARTGMSGIALGGACGLGDYIRIAVTGCTAAGHTTGSTGFRLGASCILPIMSQGFSTGLTTCGTGFGGRTGCVFPTVAQGVAAGLSAFGAGLGILAGCCAVAMTGGSYFFGVYLSTVSTGFFLGTGGSTGSGQGHGVAAIVVAGFINGSFLG